MIDEEYQSAILTAKENLQDLKERGADATGDDWEDLKKEIFTPVEIATMNLKALIISEIIKARQERGLSQYNLAELSGVKQSAIARLENGKINPTIDTIQKLLTPLGKQLAVISAAQ